MIDPAQLAKSHTEHAEQTALFCWASQQYEVYPELRWMFAIPNGGERNKAVAGALRAEGVKSGVPDIFLPAVRGLWHGLYIELKRPKAAKHARGYQSQEQKVWAEGLRQQGYGVCVAVGWEQAREFILAYLNWRSDGRNDA